jgi:hypothetical protein
LGFVNNLPDVVRHLIPPAGRHTVGIDTLTLPTDENGYTYLIVIVVMATKLAKIMASRDKSANSTAMALFFYCTTFGVPDELRSDRGSDFTSEVISLLLRWLGMEHTLAITDRHQSCGVEGTNREVLRHLSALCFDERIFGKWADHTVTPWLEYTLNSTPSSETGGYTPFELTFGSDAHKYFNLKEHANPSELRQHELLSELNSNLQAIRSASAEYQAKLIAERTKDNPEFPNTYQPGDLVLYEHHHKATKLMPTFYGPYEVLEQYKNDIQCKHLVMDNIVTIPNNKAKLYVGSYEDAYEAAKRDYDQYVVAKVVAYVGDPAKRTECSFLVTYETGVTLWQAWNSQLHSTTAFEDFCRSRRPLLPLLYSPQVARKRLSEINRSDIDIDVIYPGVSVYLDYRFYGHDHHNDIGLPDGDQKHYVFHCTYLDWTHPQKFKKITLRNNLTSEPLTLNASSVYLWGSTLDFDESYMVLIDLQLCRTHPEILPRSLRKSILHI